MLENTMNYLTESAVILVPALYVIGMIIKGTEKIPDKYIPIILLPLGIIGAIIFIGLKPESVVQGILITGGAVYTNQLVKQSKKEE